MPEGQELVVSTDMLVAGVHFPESTEPESIGHKSLAVNLSDLAAMGASPAWFTLNLSLPQPEERWLEDFCRGLFGLAQQHQCALVGGDTTRGPLTIGIQIMGLAPRGQALRRSGARPGDRIYVTGQLGEAALGLLVIQGRLELPEEHRRRAVHHLNRPAPRIRAGVGLRGLASACIDVSDGLVADLGHILEASEAGARIRLDRLPLPPAYDSVFGKIGWEAALNGGDDYELCFTVPPAQEAAFRQAAAQFGVACSYLGDIEAEPGLRILDPAGQLHVPARTGFDHFRSG